jgi:SAM-dependent methyltransferase
VNKRGGKRTKAAGIDHELRVGSSAHYEDARYYAENYRDRVEDVSYYVALAERVGGPVLEYGCGEGRIALPLAQAGLEVVGVDQSQPMLDALAAKLEGQPREVQRRLKTRRGDMRTLKLARKFPLVLCTFNTFLHLYDREDVEQFLARVRAHLAPKGRFVFDASTPVPADLAREPSRAYKLPPVRVGGVRHEYRERFDYDPMRQVLFVMMEFTPKSGDPFVTPLAHRQFFPRELEALLHYNGFVVEKLEGGFGGEPADRYSDSLVWTCRAR